MFKQVAVIGAGVMGSGIARHMAMNGAAVTLIDSNPEQLVQARKNCGDMDISCSSVFDPIVDCDYVIEAVFEELTIKHEVLTTVSQLAPEETIIASNTSSLLISDLAQAVARPDRFIGVHYNNPADMNPIVEIIPGDQTDEEHTSNILTWMSRADKFPVRCKDTPCFILNRQSLPYINEAARCLDIASPGEIDHVATERLGAGLGPFAVMNLVGLPVMAASSRNLEVLGHGYRAASTLQERSKLSSPDWELDSVDGVEKAKTAEIVKRLRGAMIFPGQDILEQQLCSRDDLHLICKQALGYEKSSPELLELFEPSVVRELIEQYLARQ